ncbi:MULTISPECIES: flagellar export chaperone FliS [Vagococcus]|uniref:flagellar export chaperone FliS n=1 Tax=Vagococcus TaxID=2737 RepID=UPI002FCC7AED
MTYTNKGNTAYLNNQVLSASPKKLIEILFEAGIKHSKMAIYQLEQGNLQEVNTQLVKVQNIILELKYSVQPMDDSDIPDQLISLYDFMYGKLLQANVEKEKESIVLVQKMLEELLETWAQL